MALKSDALLLDNQTLNSQSYGLYSSHYID
jgi:hypothetical protein